MRLLGLLAAVATAVFVFPSPLTAQESPVLIATYAEHRGGNVVYHYEVRNPGNTTVRRFVVGCDCRGALGSIPELQVLPVAATVERADDFGVSFAVPPDAVRQPPGWRARVFRPHGETGHWIEWYMPAARAGVGSGQTLGGFSVTVPGEDEAYLAGQYTAFLGLGRGSTSAALALADTTPPTLSLRTGTAPEATGATALIRVIATAKDDRDPEPRVVVESFAREDAEPRAYVIVYSATDASGNRATATARVPAPAGREPPAAPPPEERRPPAGPAKFPLPRVALLP